MDGFEEAWRADWIRIELDRAGRRLGDNGLEVSLGRSPGLVSMNLKVDCEMLRLCAAGHHPVWIMGKAKTQAFLLVSALVSGMPDRRSVRVQVS